MNAALRMTQDEFYERAMVLLSEYVPYIENSPEKMEKCGLYLRLAKNAPWKFDVLFQLAKAVDLSSFAWTRFGTRIHTKEECITALLVNRCIHENTFCELFMTQYCELDDDSIEEALFITSGFFSFDKWNDTFVRAICDILIKYGPNVPLAEIFQKEFDTLPPEVFDVIENMVVNKTQFKYNRIMIQSSLDWTCLNRTLHPKLTNEFIIKYKSMYDAARMLAVDNEKLQKSMELEEDNDEAWWRLKHGKNTASWSQ